MEKEEIIELCKKNNIDEELIFEFMEETKAFPFLMGKPSSYLLAYVETNKGIKIENGILKIFRFDKKIVDILHIISQSSTEKNCSICGNATCDKIIFQTEKGNDFICFSCFTLKILSHYLDISEKEIKGYFILLAENSRFQQIVKIFLISIHSYYIDFFDKPIGQELFRKLKSKILKKEINLSDFFDKFEYLRNYYKNIFLTGLAREIYTKTPKEFKFDHLPYFKKIKAKMSDILSGPLSILERNTNSAGQYFGKRIPPWIIESKTGKTVYGYVLEIIRQTDKAIMCKFSLLDKGRIWNEWIPKSTIEESPLQLNRHILIETLAKMGHYV